MDQVSTLKAIYMGIDTHQELVVCMRSYRDFVRL